MENYEVENDTAVSPSDRESKEMYRVAIEALAGRDEKNPMSVGELVSAITDKLGPREKSYVVYHKVKDFSRRPGSRIRSRKGRAGGYFLISEAAAVELAAKEDALPTRAEEEREKTLEKHIWPLVEFWFKEEKGISNASEEVANLKSGGTWSNPDVVALSPIEDLGFFDVEIWTAEVKPSISQWRYYFFEAVSHKRFSERSYFIYRSSNSDDGQLTEVLRYAEKYGVGVVEMQLSDEDFNKLPTWSSLPEKEKLNLLERFVERVPAPYEPISMREKIDFLRRIGIRNKSDLYTFGRG